MKKFDFNSKKMIKIIIEYILCLLVVEISIIFVNMVGISKHVENMDNFVITETSNIESTIPEDEQYIGNYKITVLEYDKLSYFIKVDYKNQIVTVYTQDENGEYTIPIRTMICSTGESTPTEGVFETSDKYQWGYLVGGVYGQYCTRITGPILFHSVPYTSQKKSSLEYWEYDKLGQPVSKGCVRLKVEDAKWIYDYCKSGTKVEFVADEEATNIIKNNFKLSDYDESLRGWDPTDPDSSNPWKEYNEQNKGERN